MARAAYRKNVFWIAIGFIFLVIGCFFLYGTTKGRDLIEDISYTVAPSPQKAFDYGVRHLDAEYPQEYDINRAAYFFNLAAAQDPTIPYLYHELARISFLQGNFRQALARIDFQISQHGDSEPNSYYVRGLIEGYMGDYAAAEQDYAYYLTFDPHDWAAMNDYAWVLLKDQKFQEAADVTAKGISEFPNNPWLLNSEATALYELGRYYDALIAVQGAASNVGAVTPEQWSTAYPGNDPRSAPEGVATFQTAVADNMHTIQLAFASSTLQSE